MLYFINQIDSTFPGIAYNYDDIHNFGAYFTVYDRKSDEGKAIYRESIQTKIAQSRHADIRALVPVLDWRDARDANIHVISDPSPDFGVPPNVFEGVVDDVPMRIVDKQIVTVSVKRVKFDISTGVLYTDRELYLPNGLITKVLPKNLQMLKFNKIENINRSHPRGTAIMFPHQYTPALLSI